MVELIQISLLNIVAKLLKFGFELGTSFFVSKDTYGEFALILSYILIFTKISSFGIPNLIGERCPKILISKYISYLFQSTINYFLYKGVVIFYTILISFTLYYSIRDIYRVF